MERGRGLKLLVLALVLLLGSPLLGAWLAGRPLTPYLSFPPQPIVVEQLGFSWPVFLSMAVFVLACIAPYAVRLWRDADVRVRTRAARSFPFWGWGALVLLLVAWWAAWSGDPSFEPIVPYSFTLLWVGYILIVNALAVRRCGSCLLLQRPLHFLGLFPVSAVFWWFFEYLNLYIRNWYYVDAQGVVDVREVLTPTLAFATVLPAVASTCYWLSGMAHLRRAAEGFPAIKIRYPRLIAGLTLLVAVVSLAALGGMPDRFYPLAWISPLLILLALLRLAGQHTLFEVMGKGDWRPLWLSALAGLICGFFWELWNYGSLLHWQYNVPYVDRFHLFEMPLIGFAGYLPFGLECILIVSLLWGRESRLLLYRPQ